MEAISLLDVLYVYMAIAVGLFLLSYHDLPAYPAMTRWESLSFLLTSPLVFLFFIVSSPVIAAMFVRVVWKWWRDTCAFRRISEKADTDDTSKGAERS